MSPATSVLRAAALLAIACAAFGCGARERSPERPVERGVALPTWRGDPWLGLHPSCAEGGGPRSCTVVSDDELRFTDAEGRVWIVSRIADPLGIDVWRRLEGTLPFVEERRMVGPIDGVYSVDACEGEGARRTTWIDGDRDGIAETTRHVTRDRATTVTRDEGADGQCLRVARTTTSDAGTVVSLDVGCDGDFESTTSSEGRLRTGSGC